MSEFRRFLRYIVWPGVILLQLIMTQVVTFLFSFLFPNAENIGQRQPVLFALFLTITFTIGVFLAGWLAIQLHWLDIKPQLPIRLVGSLIGAGLPLIAALVIYRILEPGNPFFLVSTLACILGFHIPSWTARK